MTSPSIFDIGTVTLTNGSAEVTGDGTAWAVNGVAGGMFSCAGMSVPIASVDDDTTLTLAYPWPGANAADVAYAISLLGSQAADTIWASRHWSRIVGQALLAGIHPAASGTLAERDALNPMLEDGQWFAHAEPPYDLTFYRKVPGGWEGPYLTRGVAGVGEGGIGLPGGGAVGQVLRKSGAGDGDAAWASGLTLPGGGSVGQYLRKAGAPDGDAGWATMPNFVKDYAVSLFADSGRFAGNGVKIESIPGGTAFALPPYLTAYNGTSVASIGKYITNNNDYGGSAGALNAYIKDLIDKIREPGQRRYGVEFYVAQFTMGSGTAASPVTISGTAYYLSMFQTLGPRVPAMTYHCYVRALDAPIAANQFAGQTLIKEGVNRYTTPQLISPAEGWVSLAIEDEQNPRQSNGYNPLPGALHAAASGHRFLVACPSMMGGITQVNPNVGIISGVNRWLP